MQKMRIEHDKIEIKYKDNCQDKGIGIQMTEHYKWIVREKQQEGQIGSFFEKYHIPASIARIMQRRGIRSEEQLRHFLYDSFTELADPLLMKGMKAATERLLLAKERGEKVVIYGDYDVDGITSTSILYRYFHRIGIQAGFYIPSREGEGYGLNENAVKKLKEEGYSLLITVDCGISSAELVDHMSDHIDFIVTDHHLPPDILPERAVAVINPHQKDCPYPYDDLAGCGVAFTVCRAMHKILTGEDYREDIELAALGTVADMVPLTGENRILVREGLARFPKTNIRGLAALLKAAGVVSENKPERNVTADQISFALAPRINAAGRIRHAKVGVTLLTTESMEEAEHLAEQLCGLNTERQATERAIFEEALKRLAVIHHENDMALVVDGKSWHPGVIGIVASRILERMHRPTLVITVHEGIGKGSCRSIPGFNIYEALSAQKEWLLQFGGHPMAAGFSIKEENIPRFREKLNEYAAQRITKQDCILRLEIEQYMPLPEVQLAFIQSLALLEPCGCENPRPLFASRGVYVESSRHMGADQRHFKCLLSQDGVSTEAVFWNPGEDPCRTGEMVSIAYEPEIHEWYGEHVQLIGKDIQPFEEAENGWMDRDFLAEIFLQTRTILAAGPQPTEQVQRQLHIYFAHRHPEHKIKLGLTVLEELGILTKYSHGADLYFQYQAVRNKLDLCRSPTFCKYSRLGGGEHGREE